MVSSPATRSLKLRHHVFAHLEIYSFHAVAEFRSCEMRSQSWAAGAADLVVESAHARLHRGQQRAHSKVLNEALDVLQVGLRQARPQALRRNCNICHKKQEAPAGIEVLAKRKPLPDSPTPDAHGILRLGLSHLPRQPKEGVHQCLLRFLRRALCMTVQTRQEVG